MKKLILMSLAAAAVTANADILWDQSTLSSDMNGLAGEEFSDLPDFSAYIASDVTLAANTNLTAITVYFDPGANLGATGQARVAVGTGLPTNPGAATLVNFTRTARAVKVDVTGMFNGLAGGNYWIMVTPQANFGNQGQAFQIQASDQRLKNSQWRNPSNAFGFGGDWQDATNLGTGFTDAAILVEGNVVPEPASMTALGLGLAAIAARRRRK